MSNNENGNRKWSANGLPCRYEHRRAERGARPICLIRSELTFRGGEGRGAWPGEVAVTKLEQGEMPILHTPLLLSLCVLASHLHRLCLLDRRLLHRLLSWVRAPCHLCLLDRRLLYRLLSGTAPRHLCLLDRRLLQARRAQGFRRLQNLPGERGLVEDEQGARGGSRQAPAASAKSARMPSPSKSVGGERSGLGQAGASVDDEQGARGG